VIRQLSASVRIQGGICFGVDRSYGGCSSRGHPGVAVEQLLSLASELVSSVKGTAVWLCVVPALAFLKAQMIVRVASVTLLENIEEKH
jgi:hypothetical protein